MEYKFELSEQAAQPVMSVRTRTSVGNLPQELGRIYGAVIEYLKEVGEEPTGPAFTVYYNMDMENLDIEAGFPVAKPVADKGEIKGSELPAGKQVSCMHKGPYSKMEKPYNAMTQWLTDNNCSPTGVCWEFYYNSPLEVPESELLTKIVFPVQNL